ncbi:hypothetical protein NCC49_002948 [Naganishia albida]|nr:hypothetical protein NCC49_002948 [Naganishia albida]
MAHSKSSKKAAKPAERSTAPKDAHIDSPFLRVNTDIRLSIPPVFATDLNRGAMEMLDSLVMRYTPALQAVLLAYSDIKFADTTANILNDCPFAIADVSFNAVVWSPKIGHRLAGTHSLSSASHISLILYKTFNVSIPLEHIPLDEYEFDEDVPASEIREVDGQVLDSDEEESSDEEDADEEEDDVAVGKAEVIETGRWRNKKTGKLLGAGGEEIAFTVTGLQVSNQMLSLTGSLKKNAKPTSQTYGSASRPIPIAPGSQLARERATGAFAQKDTSRLPAANAITNPPSNPNKSSIVQASSSNLATSASAPNSKRRTKHKSSIGVDAASQMQVDQAEHEALTRQPVEPESQAGQSEDAEAAKKRRKEERKARKSAAASSTEVKAEEGSSRKEKKDKKRTAADANPGEDGGSKKKRKKD